MHRWLQVAHYNYRLIISGGVFGRLLLTISSLSTTSPSPPISSTTSRTYSSTFRFPAALDSPPPAPALPSTSAAAPTASSTELSSATAAFDTQHFGECFSELPSDRPACNKPFSGPPVNAAFDVPPFDKRHFEEPSLAPFADPPFDGPDVPLPFPMFRTPFPRFRAHSGRNCGCIQTRNTFFVSASPLSASSARSFNSNTSVSSVGDNSSRTNCSPWIAAACLISTCDPWILRRQVGVPNERVFSSQTHRRWGTMIRRRTKPSNALALSFLSNSAASDHPTWFLQASMRRWTLGCWTMSQVDESGR